MDYLEALNPAQREAVLHTEGPLLILAGAGSGKTRVLTYRVAHLIAGCGIPPTSIFTATFTNKAAAVMRERILALVGEAASGVTMATFHSTCARWLRREIAIIGGDPNFNIYDQGDQLKLVKQALKDLDLGEERLSPSSVLHAISNAKSDLRDAEAMRQHAKGYYQEQVARVYGHYQELLARYNALDFDDLLLLPIQIFRDHLRVLERYQERFQYVMVDEYQDTNHAQHELTRLLAQGHGNVCVVGDDDQSIYSWRGADIRNILEFEKIWPGCAVMRLEQNYRSTANIVVAAGAVVCANRARHRKTLWTDNAPGEPILLKEAFSPDDEAGYVAREILRLRQSGQAQLGECAVMYRTNAQTRALEQALNQNRVPFRIVASVRFYERQEVKDVLCYLRLLFNPEDWVSLDRIINVPPRGLGAKSVQIISEWAARQGTDLFSALAEAAEIPGLSTRAQRAAADFYRIITELLVLKEQASLQALYDRMLEMTGYADFLDEDRVQGGDRWENVVELRNAANDLLLLPARDALVEFLQTQALVSDTDQLDDSGEKVTLITLHAAKGLEFPVVFLVGLNEGLLPHARALESGRLDEVEEERRLCYVGMTRAMRHLYMVTVFQRRTYGGEGGGPSRFLADLPRDLVHLVGADRLGANRAWHEPSWVQPAGVFASGNGEPEEPALAGALRDGDRVRHAVFGEGLVVSVREGRGSQEVKVAFEGRGVKTLDLAFAPLERLR